MTDAATLASAWSKAAQAPVGAGRSGGPVGIGAERQATAMQGEDQEYLGLVKSYNDRRGFGFVTCSETAAKYGRDVYIAKAEAQLAFSDARGGKAPAAAADKQQPPSIAEEDLVRFHVRLSMEGYPQAERIQLMRKFQGTVVYPPAAAEGEQGGGFEDAATLGRITSDDLGAVFGEREAIVRRSSCGQARLAPGDRVTFCVQGECGSGARGGRQQQREAQLVLLVPRPQQGVGCILGCCVLHLPRAPLYEGGPGRADLWLDCHALGDRIILAGLPPDADDAELMRFFAKQGASGTALAHSRSGNFASISFPSVAEVVRFVARGIHTFADDKETRIARLLPRCACGPAMAVDNSRLPGLPAPAVMPGEEVGVLLVMWSPLVLATGYVVEMRPAGVQAPWSAVDASSGHLGGDSARHFDRECSSCRVSGLPSNTVFEARVGYFTSCGCRSDASDASEWCMPVPNAAPMGGPGPMGAQFMSQAGAYGGASMAFRCPWPQGPSSGQMPSHLAAPVADAWPAPWQVAGAHTRGLSAAVAAGVGVQVAGFCGVQPLFMQSPSWRCAHGTVIPPPSMPELRPADDSGYTLLVQWPSVAHAAAYVVELLESGSSRVERFIRSVPVQSHGSLVELRVGGLRPGGPAGRCYVAQVRSVATCGCESEPSPPGMSQPLGATALAAPRPLPTLSLAGACAPPAYPGAAAAPPPRGGGEGGGVASGYDGFSKPAAFQQLHDGGGAAALGYGGCSKPAAAFQQQPFYHAPAAAAAGCPVGQQQHHQGGGGLPTLLQSSRLPCAPPPMGPAPDHLAAAHKELAPEVAGNEDCIILD